MKQNTKNKLVTYDVTFHKAKWQCKIRKKNFVTSPILRSSFFNKRDFIRYVSKLLKAEFAKTKLHGFSLRIHRVNGTFQEERTYPRSADPRRSKG